MKRSILAVLLLSCLNLLGGSKKDDRLVVQFSLQGAESDGQKISIPQQVAGQQVFFRHSLEIATKDIVSFRPFPAEDGYSYGIMLQLNTAGANRLAAVTSANKGRLFMARLNGRPLDVVTIDKTISDGILVIWQGVTTREIGLADKIIPRIGQSPQEWRKKK